MRSHKEQKKSYNLHNIPELMMQNDAVRQQQLQ